MHAHMHTIILHAVMTFTGQRMCSYIQWVKRVNVIICVHFNARWDIYYSHITGDPLGEQDKHVQPRNKEV